MTCAHCGNVVSKASRGERGYGLEWFCTGCGFMLRRTTRYWPAPGSRSY